MEQPPFPDLLLLPEPLPACPLTGEPIRAVRAELTLHGPETLVLRLVLGCCEARWYALLPQLLDVLAEEDWAPEDVEGFEVDGRAAEAALWAEGPQRAVPWATFRERAAQTRQRAAEPPPPPEAVRALPVLPEHWEVAARGMGWVHDAEPPRPAFLALVVDADGSIRHSDVRAGEPHDAEALAAAVRAATRAETHAGFREGRPRALRTADPATERALADVLGPAGISVEAGPTPLADEALGEALLRLGPPLSAPLFALSEPAEVRAYFKAARRFYRARPWQRLRGDRYVAFRLGDGPWLYASVMGQAGVEPGLSLFDSWLRLCRLVHNEPTPFELAMGTAQLDAAGAAEDVTLFPPETMLPEDVAFLHAQGVKPVQQGQYPLSVRFASKGLSRSAFPLAFLTALMEGVVTAVEARRAREITSIKQTLEAAGLTLSLRYPARGDEHLEGRAGAYRLVAEGQDSPYTHPLPRGERLEIEVPGTATLAEVTRALRAEIGEAVWFSGFGTGEVYLWHARGGPGTPSPRVADLHGLAPLWLEQVDVRYPLHLTPLPTTVADGIRVRRC